MSQVDSDTYSQTSPSPSNPASTSSTVTAGITHGAGANPSTAAGIVVLIALGGLLLIRRSFRRIA